MPHLISVDNYFKNREDTPLDEDGAPDFESLDALDCEQFQKDLEALLDGQEVNMPTYNFKTGRRYSRRPVLKSICPHTTLRQDGGSTAAEP